MFDVLKNKNDQNLRTRMIDDFKPILIELNKRLKAQGIQYRVSIQYRQSPNRGPGLKPTIERGTLYIEKI